jgi:N-acetylmuramoyl-L-alanine amidase
LELENAKFSFNEDVTSIENEMVGSFRFGAVTADKSRLVITLNAPFDIMEKTLAKEEGSERHSLDFLFQKVTPEVFSAKVDEQQALLGTSGEVVIKGDRVRAGPKKTGVFHVVIDPGHGGIDGGSKGRKTGILEKDITLKISKKIGELIEKSGPFEVSYTREDDIFVSLRERQKFAQRQNADLMISIHADSLKEFFVRGATIYTLAKKATDALSQQIADSENLADIVAGLAAPDSQNDVTDILADLTLRETSRFSLHFSTLLVERMASEVAMIKNPQRAASFAVLKNAEVPSALIELGYLSNEEDEKLLNDSVWQDKVAVIVASAVKAFFADKRPHEAAKQ